MEREEADKRYPLYWPVGWKRTGTYSRGYSRFRVSEAESRDHMLSEITRLGGCTVVISTNVKLRLDGLPYANQGRIEDPGVAVYFKLDGKDVTMASDQYVSIGSNYRAIGKTIECLRGIQRYGASDLLERAFMGFTQITYAPEPEWWQVLGFEHDEILDLDRELVRERYHTLAKKHHPDANGDPEMMRLINAAWATAKERIPMILE